MRRIPAVEEQPLVAEPADGVAIYERLVRLREELRPRLAFVGGSPTKPVLRNLVGSVQVSASVVVDIAPKITGVQAWQSAVIDLLSTNRIHAGGRTSTAEPARRPLPDAFAYIYADQLDRAIRTAGPLLVIRNESQRKPALTGRLDVTAWVQSRVLAPHLFPQGSTVLTAENDFTRALAWVAIALAARVNDAQVRSRLLRLAREARPGLPEHPMLDPDVANRPLPPQWREYLPAWTTAIAILRRISPLHRQGTQQGLNLAVEPWPLLETLLERSLRIAAQIGVAEGQSLSFKAKSAHPLLNPIGSEDPHGVEPDGLLLKGGLPLASFEVKYSTMKYFRTHYFQALTTAAAVGAPLAVLVYPQAFEPQVWTNIGATTPPTTLAAIGVDMYSYRSRTGEQMQGARLFELVNNHGPSC